MESRQNSKIKNLVIFCLYVCKYKRVCVRVRVRVNMCVCVFDFDGPSIVVNTRTTNLPTYGWTNTQENINR